VTPATWDLFRGDSGTSRYTVSVSKFTDSDQYFVEGQVCVTNGGEYATQNLEIWDRVQYKMSGEQFQDLPGAEQTIIPPEQLEPGEGPVCYSYKIYFTPVSGAVAYRNAAKVTITNHAGHQGVEWGPEPKADFSLPGTPDTVVNDKIHVTDTNRPSEPPWEFSNTGSVTYDKTFTCDVDKGLHPNTATISESGQSDDASVTVNCYGLQVSKTAQTSLTRTYEWTINKSANPATLNLFTGDSGTSTYTVSVTRTGHTDSSWAVSGTITVHNLSPIAAAINSVADIVPGSIGEASLSCDVTFPYTLAAGGTLSCTYSASLPDGSTRTNTATATLQNYSYDYHGNPTKAGTTDFFGSASVDFANAKVTEVNPLIHVTDTNGPSWTFSASGSETYDKTFTCDDDKGEHDNTATITETGQNNDASVMVECSVGYDIEVSKTAETWLTRTHEWTINKSVTPDAWTLLTGQNGTSTYTVSVEKTGYTDSDWLVNGTITVKNTGQTSATIASVSDTISPAISATVDCGGASFPYDLAADATLKCTYSASLPNNSSRTNTATVTVSATQFNATALVDFTGANVKEVYGSINVDDTNDDRTWTFTESNSESYPETFTCNIDQGQHNNTATIRETGQSDDATVMVECSGGQTAALTVIKHVISDHQGMKEAKDFMIHVMYYDAANDLWVDVPGSPHNGSESGTLHTGLNTGLYKVAEDPPPPLYVQVSITGDCNPADGTVTVEANTNKECTITNADPALVVIKHVIGGSNSASDFTITVDGKNAIPATFPGSESGTRVVLDPDVYSVTETPITGYTTTYSADCSGTIVVDEPTRTCVITNEYSGGYPTQPVGGELYSVDKAALVQPYVGLLGLLGALATAVATTRSRRP
jgi:hypothetical protein